MFDVRAPSLVEQIEQIKVQGHKVRTGASDKCKIGVYKPPFDN